MKKKSCSSSVAKKKKSDSNKGGNITIRNSWGGSKKVKVKK